MNTFIHSMMKIPLETNEDRMSSFPSSVFDKFSSFPRVYVITILNCRWFLCFQPFSIHQHSQTVLQKEEELFTGCQL